MAKAAAKPKKEVSMEEALWKSADKLRGSVEPAEYKHVVLSLFFLKFASDKFEAQRKTIAEKFGEKFIDNVAFYTKDNVFFLPEDSRWSYIIEHAKQDDIALKIDTALYNIEKANPALRGALPDNYYSRLHIDTAKLASLLDEINRINTDDKFPRSYCCAPYRSSTALGFSALIRSPPHRIISGIPSSSDVRSFFASASEREESPVSHSGSASHPRYCRWRRRK